MTIRPLLLLGTALVTTSAAGQDQSGTSRFIPLGQHPLANRELVESSGLAPSRAHPGLLWTINDSGNKPSLYLVDTTGGDRGVVQLQGAINEDWEALAVAPCGREFCLYVADTGDNQATRDSVRIYRVPEPGSGYLSAPADAVVNVRFSNGPRNVEAIFVTASQDVFLIEKNTRARPGMYRLPGRAWETGTGQAELVQELPIPSQAGFQFQVTDAAFDPVTGRVAVRTYRYLYFFTFDGTSLTPDPAHSRCDLSGLDIQGEAVAWLDPTMLATTSERVLLRGGGTISRISCP